MKILISLLLTMSFAGPVLANIDKSDPPKERKKARLVQIITMSMSETQALLLEETMESLTLEELSVIKENPEEFEDILFGLENRIPDDKDEHGAN